MKEPRDKVPVSINDKIKEEPKIDVSTKKKNKSNLGNVKNREPPCCITKFRQYIRMTKMTTLTNLLPQLRILVLMTLFLRLYHLIVIKYEIIKGAVLLI